VRMCEGADNHAENTTTIKVDFTSSGHGDGWCIKLQNAFLTKSRRRRRTTTSAYGGGRKPTNHQRRRRRRERVAGSMVRWWMAPTARRGTRGATRKRRTGRRDSAGVCCGCASSRSEGL
jgi:hypothetical protein